MSADQQDLTDYMGLAKFSNIVATYSTTKQSPFKVRYEVDMLQPAHLTLKGAHSTLEFYQDGEDLVKKCEQVPEMTKLLLEKTQKCYKK